MHYLTIKRRLLNAIPHYILHFIIFNLLSGLLIIGLEMGSGNMQAAPFVVMQMLIFPIDFIISTLMYPNGYEVDLAYFLLFGVMLTTESIYFTILDYLSINEKNNRYTLRTTEGKIPSIQEMY